MKNYLIIIVFLGSVLAGFGQPSEGGANGTSVQKHPFRFHTYTPHIYVDAFLNDSLPLRMVYDLRCVLRMVGQHVCGQSLRL